MALLVKLAFIKLLLISLTCSPIARGAGESSLLGLAHRPSITEIKSLPPGPSDFVSRFSWSDKDEIEELCNIVKEEGPRLIAMLEGAFPGATFAPMGRDAAILGDVLEVFYGSLGQYERVRRLNVSTRSFVNVTPKQVAAYLESNGVDFSPASKPFPFVIIDRTSYRENQSQSWVLMSAAYDWFAKQGGRREDFLDRFHLASTTHYGTEDRRLEDFASRREFDRKEFRRHMIRVPQSILQLVSDLSDSQTWHGPFKEITIRPTGVETLPGKVKGQRKRRVVIETLQRIIAIVESPQFLRAVQKKASKLGYEFPLTREPEQKEMRFHVDVNLIEKEALKVVEKLKDPTIPSMPKFDSFGMNYVLIELWFEKNQVHLTSPRIGQKVHDLFVEMVTTTYEKGWLKPKDAKKLLKMIKLQTSDSTQLANLKRCGSIFK